MAEIEEISCEDFLEIVWGNERSWVDLPAKINNYWVPWHHKWTGEADTDITRRIDACLRDSESLYFSAGKFEARGREYESFKPPQWLWADLDEVHPAGASQLGLLPTLAWESSPGRFQGMWRLDKRVQPDSWDKLNQALSYFLGADHGGWDRTQVLRLPGTRNFKYRGGPEVRLLWHHSELVYRASYVWGKVRASLPTGGLPEGQVLSTDRPRAMPAMARALLRVPSDSVVEGERSAKLWQIECLLAEAGWGEDAIYAVVEGSAWNKWAGVGTGERRLRGEIRKAIHHVARKAAAKSRAGVPDVSPPGEGGEGGDDGGDDGDGEIDVGEGSSLSLPWVRYGSFMAMEMEEPRWLIKDIWTAGSHGIFGGEPKTSKTTLSLALALSVASGKAFLGQYRVSTPGPVLFVQEENAPWMVQDRLRKIAQLYGLISAKEITERRAPRGALGKSVIELEFPTDVPLRLLNNAGLDLTLEEHRDALWAECEVIRPKLVVLDPMYLLFAGVNFNDAHGLAPYLKWLLALRNEFQTAIIVIHHYKKMREGAAQAGGQRLMGNATLHGFIDSALYAEQSKDPVFSNKAQGRGMYFTKVTREFRSMEPQSDIEIGLRLGRPGALDMAVDVRMWDLQEAIEKAILDAGGMTVNQLAEALGIDKRTALGRCRDSEVLTVISGARGRGNSHRVVPSDNGL